MKNTVNRDQTASLHLPSYIFSLLSLFVLSSFRYFVFSPGVFSAGVIWLRKDEMTPGEKTKRRNNARRKNEKTPREKTTKFKFQTAFFFSFRVASFRREKMKWLNPATIRRPYGQICWSGVGLYMTLIACANGEDSGQPAESIHPSLHTARFCDLFGYLKNVTKQDSIQSAHHGG